MKYFITGGTGFLGSTLARRLNNRNNQVIVFGRNKIKGESLVNEGIEFVQGDLVERDKIIRNCRNVDYIFHCGALSSPWGKYEDFYNANVVGTINVVQAAKVNSVRRLIHVSTPSIYFDFTDKFDITEDSQLPSKFVNHYALTKFLAEEIVDEAFKQGLETIIIRPRAIFGIGDNAIFPRLIERNKNGLPIIDKGNAVIDITYVENVVDSLLLCRDASKECLGQKFNITNGEPKKLIEIIEEVFTELSIKSNFKQINYSLGYFLASLVESGHRLFLPSKEPSILRYSIGVFGKSQTLSIEKAKTELGYDPRVSIEEGIKEFAKWWKEQ